MTAGDSSNKFDRAQLLLGAERCFDVMKTIVKEILARDTRSWDNSKLPEYPSEQPEIVVMKIVIPPDTRLPMHFHPVINAGMVLAGHLTVVADDGNERTFHPGEAIIEMVGKRHYGENRGDEAVELVMFYASTPGEELSEEGL